MFRIIFRYGLGRLRIQVSIILGMESTILCIPVPQPWFFCLMGYSRRFIKAMQYQSTFHRSICILQRSVMALGVCMRTCSFQVTTLTGVFRLLHSLVFSGHCTHSCFQVTALTGVFRSLHSLVFSGHCTHWCFQVTAPTGAFRSQQSLVLSGHCTHWCFQLTALTGAFRSLLSLMLSGHCTL